MMLFSASYNQFLIRNNFYFTENKNYYNLGYAAGVAGDSSNITYIRHYHSSSCYYTCDGNVVKIRTGGINGSGIQTYVVLCQKCGSQGYRAEGDLGIPCGASLLKCNYSDGQIISATITYN